MTEREAIKVFDGLRKAMQAIKPGEDMQAWNVLTHQHVIPPALGDALGSAFANLRAVFAAIKRWEHRNLSK